jgi:hypothetical protein
MNSIMSWISKSDFIKITFKIWKINIERTRILMKNNCKNALVNQQSRKVWLVNFWARKNKRSFDEWFVES